MRCVEDICVFYEKAPVYNPIGLRIPDQKKIRKRKAIDDSVYESKTLVKKYVQQLSGYPNNLLYFEVDNAGGTERYHPTQKPVKLLEYLIRTYSNSGDLVLDNTMGSGSTGVASINTGRNFIGIEKNKKYFDNAAKRIAEAERLYTSNLFDIVTLEGSMKAPLAGGTIQEDFFK
jgi:site-specific DNA-methyltransferase (adenine-specific)